MLLVFIEGFASPAEMRRDRESLSDVTFNGDRAIILAEWVPINLLHLRLEVANFGNKGKWW